MTNQTNQTYHVAVL